MPSLRSPSPPSPLAKPPIPLAPGPRATALHAIFSTALAATLKANSYANFSACFPTPARHCPGALENVWHQLNGKLEHAAMREFEDILREKGVVAGLNELDRLVGEAGRGRGVVPVAPHTLSAEELYRAYLAPGLVEVEGLLEEKLKRSQERSLEVGREVQTQRGEIEMLMAALEGRVRDLEGAVGAMEGDGLGADLRREIEEIEGELRML